MNLEAIYRTVCRVDDPAAELFKMGDAALAALSLHLRDSGVRSGIPAVVAGLIDLEIVNRWNLEHAPQGGAVGEGAI